MAEYIARLYVVFAAADDADATTRFAALEAACGHGLGFNVTKNRDGIATREGLRVVPAGSEVLDIRSEDFAALYETSAPVA
jgi:hypothetical protein